MWTTFLKARLNCSYNGFYLNQLYDITEPVIIDLKLTVFAVFSTPENSLPGAAVCSYTLDSIHKSMQSSFPRYTSTDPNKGNPPKPEHHPGKCPGKRVADEESDKELLYIQSHPQMEKQVYGSILATYQGGRWSAINVDNQAGPSRKTVLYIGTFDGKIIRALPPNKLHPHGVILEERNVFIKSSCFSQSASIDEKRVLSIMIDNEKDWIIVAFQNCVITQPLRSCHLYECKNTCLGLSDPYCGWDGTLCRRFDATSENLEGQDSKITNTSCKGATNPVIGAAKTGVNDRSETPGLRSSSGSSEFSGNSFKPDDAFTRETYPLWYVFVVGTVSVVVTLVVIAVAYCVCGVCCKPKKSKEATKKKKIGFGRGLLRTLCFVFSLKSDDELVVAGVKSESALKDNREDEESSPKKTLLKRTDSQRSRPRSDPATPTKVRRKSSVKDPLLSEAKLSSKQSESVAVDEPDCPAVMTPEVFTPHAAHHYQHMRPLLEDPQQLMHPLLNQNELHYPPGTTVLKRSPTSPSGYEIVGTIPHNVAFSPQIATHFIYPQVPRPVTADTTANPGAATEEQRIRVTSDNDSGNGGSPRNSTCVQTESEQQKVRL